MISTDMPIVSKLPYSSHSLSSYIAYTLTASQKLVSLTKMVKNILLYYSLHRFLKAKRFFVNAVRCCEMVVQPRWTKWKLLVVRLDACIQAD